MAPAGRARALAVSAAALLAALPALAGEHPRLRIGDTLPDLTLPGADGKPLRLRDLRGRVLAISFYSPYCAPCRRELPVLGRVVERVGQGTGGPRPALLVIAFDTIRGNPQLLSSRSGARWLLDNDGRARAAFDPRAYPCTFLVDERGVVRHINRGFGSGYEPRVERWLRALRRPER